MRCHTCHLQGNNYEQILKGHVGWETAEWTSQSTVENHLPSLDSVTRQNILYSKCQMHV